MGFVVQSALDRAQIEAIAPLFIETKTCLNHSSAMATGTCTTQQIQKLNGFMDDFVQDFRDTGKIQAAGQSGFTGSCPKHMCTEWSRELNGYTIEGVIMKDAILKWLH